MCYNIIVIDMKKKETNELKGFTEKEVEERIALGLVNYDDGPKTKTIKEIILSNILTYFNFLNMALGASVFIAGVLDGQALMGLKNCLFMGVIIINSIISIIEEIISKKIIDKLSMLNESKIDTIRDGNVVSLSLDELVMDDITLLKSGHQVVADSLILDGSVEVNESLLTGEPDSILKKEGDMVLSGSFIVSGNAYARVTHVGKDNYISVISAEAKYESKVHSVIMDSFESLLKILSFLIIPIGIIMFFSQLAATGGSVTGSIFYTVAALIGMIPEGLVLLTSSVMAVSVIRLSKYKVLVQQLYCIETLARVDVICLDKTGTLTMGKMQVHDILPSKPYSKEEMANILSIYGSLSGDENATIKAIREKFGDIVESHKEDELPFSSERKFSGIKVQDIGSIYLGAPEFLLKKDYSKYEDILKDKTLDYRTLVIAKNSEPLSKNPTNLEVIGFIFLEDIIRENASSTLDYLKSQGVLIKIISGDNAKTVEGIARRCGLDNLNSVNTDTLSDEELVSVVDKVNVFGRVTPKQKKLIVSTLQSSGECVAMTGDGVNDVLALKQSDCAISVASGSEAARNVSKLVLLNDDFGSIPYILKEGRRTINNIERSASLLLVKTIYTILLILFSVIISSKYFFIPIQLTLITTFTIGTPSFILALEPNTDLVKGKFLLKVVSRALPTSLTVLFNVILVTCFTMAFNLSYEMQSSLSVYLTAITGLIYLYKICKPFTIIRGTLFTVMLAGFLFCITREYAFFNLIKLNPTSILIIFVLALDSLYVYKRLNYLITKAFHKLDPTIEIETI